MEFFSLFLFFFYERLTHFHHFGTLKNSTIDMPISILLGRLHTMFNRKLLHRFLLCLHKLTHLFSHLKSKKKLTSLQICSIELSENVYINYTQIKSQVTNKLQRYVGPKKVQICTKNSPKWTGQDFPDFKPQFFKRRLSE